jgi:hypothetical protein
LRGRVGWRLSHRGGRTVTDDLTPIPFPDPPTDPTGRAAFWQGVVADFAASGLSVRAFCLARGLTERKFYTWRKNVSVRRKRGRAAAGFVGA